MAALRNTAINIIRLCGGTNIAAAHRGFSYQPTDVLDALTTADRTADRQADQDIHDFARALDAEVTANSRQGLVDS
jgi:hypothetical protein